MRYGSITIVVALLCASGSLMAQEGQTSTGNEYSQEHTASGSKLEFHKDTPISGNVGKPQPDHSDHSRENLAGPVVPQNPNQNAINQVLERIKEIKARRDAIVQGRFDLLKERDADFKAGLGQEWNNKMDELNGQAALNLDEFVREREILRELQQQR